MEKFDEIRLDPDAMLRTSWLYALTRKINTAPSLYLAAGAIHGCVLCEEDRPLLYMEDVGRHNAIDKIAGYMHLQRRLAGRQDLLHDRPADLGDGDQDRADADPDPDLALGLYRLGRRSGAPGRAHPDRPRQGQALRGAGRQRAHRLRRRSAARSRTSSPGSRARRAWPTKRRREDRREGVVGCCSPAGCRGAWAAATRRCGCSAGCRCSTGSSSGCGRRSRRWCSTPMATRRASPGSACRSSPTAFPISPGRSPACWPGSTGPRSTGRIARWSSASRPTRRFCRAISSPGSRRGIDEAGADLACAASGGQAHPVIGLWPVRLREDLRRAVVDGGHSQGRSVDRALSPRHGRVRQPADRSVLQRQPPRGSRPPRRQLLRRSSETP